MGNFIATTTADEVFDGGDLLAEITDGLGLGLSRREAIALANADPDASTITFAGATFASDAVIRLNKWPLVCSRCTRNARAL